MLPTFTCLFFLENPDIYVLEVKRTDLADTSAPGDLLQWVKINKETLDITALTFSSMDSAGDIEERWFEQGYLKFNHNEGTFIEKYNSAQHALQRKMAYKMPTPVKTAIGDFLSRSV